MTYVMGGRNDDVKRASKPHKKKRPLSAVIEEHEADDSIPRINNNNNDNGVTSYYTNSTKADDSSSKFAEGGTDANRLADSAEAAGGKSETTVPASSSAQVPYLNLPASGDGDSERKDNSSSSSRSPKSPRRSSLRSGRRQALTPSFSPKLGRRGGAPVLTSRLSVPRHPSDSDDEDNDDMLSPSDMTRLRQTADRLHLSTRRPSFMQWRAQYVECPEFPLPAEKAGNGDVTGQHGAEGGGRWTAERTERINTALDWILNELQEMRTQDQQLARQLLTIRSDLHQLKLARSCEEHQDMLDDVQSELEDLQEFADVLDLPVPTLSDSPLKHLGVTRMNFSARRFSTC